MLESCRPPCILRLFLRGQVVHRAWGQNEEFWSHTLCVTMETFSTCTVQDSSHWLHLVLNTQNAASGLRNCLLDAITLI